MSFLEGNITLSYWTEYVCFLFAFFHFLLFSHYILCQAKRSQVPFDVEYACSSLWVLWCSIFSHWNKNIYVVKSKHPVRLCLCVWKWTRIFQPTEEMIRMCHLQVFNCLWLKSMMQLHTYMYSYVFFFNCSQNNIFFRTGGKKVFNSHKKAHKFKISLK